MSMQEIRGDLEGPLNVTVDLSVHGRLKAGAIVASGARLILRGISEGDILVQPRGSAELWGVMEGSVVNRGGKVCVFGQVSGDVATSADGFTSISSDSL